MAEDTNRRHRELLATLHAGHTHGDVSNVLVLAFFFLHARPVGSPSGAKPS